MLNDGCVVLWDWNRRELRYRVLLACLGTHLREVTTTVSLTLAQVAPWRARTVVRTVQITVRTNANLVGKWAGVGLLYSREMGRGWLSYRLLYKSASAGHFGWGIANKR
jgi:hypothetical protein